MKLRKKAREKSKSYDKTLSRMSWLGSHSRLLRQSTKKHVITFQIYTHSFYTQFIFFIIIYNW